METFSEWLDGLLKDRGWSRSEAARRGGVSASMYDKVINQQATPGLKFCMGVAKAFGLELELVLAKANLTDQVMKPEEKKRIIKDENTAYELNEITSELQKRIDQTILDFFEEYGFKRVK